MPPLEAVLADRSQSGWNLLGAATVKPFKKNQNITARYPYVLLTGEAIYRFCARLAERRLIREPTFTSAIVSGMEARGKPADTDNPFPGRDPHSSFSSCGQDKNWQKNGRQKNRRHLLPSMFLPTENGRDFNSANLLPRQP
jgi:hypothetical protein